MFNGIKEPRAGLLLVISIISIIRLAVIGGIPFSPDEAYYWSWSLRPAVCYYDQPGMIAWVDWLATAGFGQSTPFTARVPAVVLSALTMLLLYRAYQDYSDDKTQAVVFTAAFSLLPFSWLYGLLIIHDTALMPWLALSYWAIVRLVKYDGRARDWALLAVGLTGAMYTKFSAVMIAWGLGLFMLWSPKGRRWWRTWPPYAAGAAAAMLYSPVIIWNARHDYISLHAVRELTSHGLPGLSDRVLSALSYVLSQVGMFTPILGVLMFMALAKAVRQAVRQPDDDRAVMAVCLVAPVFLYFFQQSFKSLVFGNWPNVYYIPLAMLAMREAAQIFRKTGPDLDRRAKTLKALVLAGAALNVVFIIAATLHLESRVFRAGFEPLEVKYNMDKRIDWRLDLDFGGWEEMRRLVMKEKTGTDFILARRYQVAGMLEFMLPGHPRVECYNQGQRGNQWDLWSGLDQRAGQTALYVDYKRMPEEVRARCAEVEPVLGAAPLVVGEPPREIKRWYLYRCRGWTPEDDAGGPGP